MQNDSRLDDAIKLIMAKIHDVMDCVRREGFEQGRREGYAKGQHDATARIRAVLQMDEGVTASCTAGLAVGPDDETQDAVVSERVNSESSQDGKVERKRAPKGLPREFTDRSLRNRPDGASLADIMSAAETNFERMIAASTIRGELRKGKVEGRYEDRGGRWFLKDPEN